MHIDQQKRAIRAAFGGAAPHYDSVAHVQRRIADALLDRCHMTDGISLDAGSGTGHAIARLETLGASCVALDHAAPMLRQGRGSAICGDIESMPVRTASIALYYSSLAWQWTNSACAIREAARVLQPGRQLAVATLGPDTLRELRDAFRQADQREHVRNFAPAESYESQLEAAGFEDIHVHRQPFVAYATDFRSILRDLKALGASTLGIPSPQGLFGVQRFRRAELHHERLREPAGLPVTYDVVFIHARRTAMA